MCWRAGWRRSTRVTGGRYGQGSLGLTQYFADISLLFGGRLTLGARAVVASRLIEVPRAALLPLMARMPEMGDSILTVLAARRRRLLESGQAGLVLIGAEADRDIRAVAAFAQRNKLPARNMTLAEALAAGRPPGPAVIFDAGAVITPPSPRALARRLRPDLDVARDEVVNVIIVGGGPAGVAAGVGRGSPAGTGGDLWCRRSHHPAQPARAGTAAGAGP